MSGFVRGPFTIKYGGNTITDIEQATVALTQDTQQKTTLGGIKREFDGPILCTVVIKVMRSDIATLATLLPQYFVPSGQSLSSGELISDSAGAIDIKALSDNAAVHADLDLISTGSPGQVFRLVDARPKVEAAAFDNYLGVIDVKFIGEPAEGVGSVQMFNNGAVSTIS
jgi:hypothetical protein